MPNTTITPATGDAAVFVIELIVESRNSSYTDCVLRAHSWSQVNHKSQSGKNSDLHGFKVIFGDEKSRRQATHILRASLADKSHYIVHYEE